MDDTSFLVNLVSAQQQSVAPVVQNEQAGVEHCFVFDGSVADVVHRFVYRCVGIEVASELDAFAFAPLYDAQPLLIAGEVLGAVEGHVLQEVGQSSLVGFFLNGAYLLGNVEFSPFFGQSIVADVISQSIVQLTDAHVRVGRDRRQLHLCRCTLHVAAE